MSGEVGVPDQDAIEQELEELLRFNETLMRENELFESHLQRTNPHLLDDEEEGSSKGRKKPQKRSQQMLLTAEQKYDIAVQEMEEVREEILQTKQNSEQLMDSLRSRMEECDVRIAEIKKDAYEFKRDIVTGAENFRTGKIVAEKAVRYMEEKLRAKAAIAEKLRLKNMTIKSQIQKVRGAGARPPPRSGRAAADARHPAAPPAAPRAPVLSATPSPPPLRWSRSCSRRRTWARSCT